MESVMRTPTRISADFGCRALIRLLALAAAVGAHAVSLGAQQPIPAPLVEGFGDGDNWMLQRDLVYRIGINTPYTITVPKGFVTDFGSIPKIFRPVLGSTGPYSQAAVVHDYLYWVQSCTRKQSDNLLAIAMRESGVSAIKHWAIYSGVRAGGTSAWDNDRAERASKLIRTVPAPYDTVPATGTWDQYRAWLKANNVASAIEPPVAKRVCAVGNTTGVPKAPR
jgi:Protein of unknown function (DUF1353).